MQWQQLSNTVIEKPVILGRLQDEFHRINVENIIQIICIHAIPPNHQHYKLSPNFKPISYSANINPKYYQYGLGTVGHLKVKQSQDSQLSYEIYESKTDELVIDGQITAANEDLKSQNPHTFYTYPITVRPSDISNTKQVHIPQYLCFAMSAIKHAIASKFNDGYIQFMDKTWYSKAIYFKLDYYSPAYVNENLTVKSWSDASNNRINCQIMRDNDCLSTFSTSFNPDLKYIPDLLPLALDVVNYDLFTITYNLDNFFHYRDRFNQPDLCKFLFAYAETLGTSVRYGIWDIPKLLSGTKGSMVLIANQCTIDPVFYTMDPDASSRLSLQLTSISNRSFISTYEIIDNQTEKVMHRTDSITVFLKDGKPEVFPDSFKETLLRKVPFKISAEKPQPLFDSIPSNHYTYHRKVRFSDLDFNDHAGYANLATFCMDAASNAISSKSSAYKLDFGQDFNPSCVRQINFVCRSQLFPDDEFAVDTWQGSENNTLYFNVRQGNKMICQSEIVIDPQSICRSN